MEETEKITQVYVIVYLRVVADTHITKPRTIVVDSLPKVYQHVSDILTKNIKLLKLKSHHETAMLSLAEAKLHERVVQLWEQLKMHGDCEIPFHLTWEDEPQVVL